MSAIEPLIRITAEGGKLRADLPATTIEAENAEGILNQVERIVEAVKIALKSSLDDTAEETALRAIEQNAPRRAALERLAARYPPPQEWFDEPE